MSIIERTENLGDVKYDLEEYDRESLENKLDRLSKVDSSNIVSGDFSWIDEVVLVALGKKPIAHTHFGDLEIGDWDEDIEDWCVEQGNVMSFSVMEYRHNIDYEPDRSMKLKYRKNGKIVSAPIFENKGVSSIVWFRSDTKKDALVIRHLSRLQQDGGGWKLPYFHIIQGILYGYPLQKIKDFIVEHHEEYADDLDYYIEKSYDYIDELKSLYDC